MGAGSGRLDLEIVMGLATVRDAGADAGGASSGPARTAAEGTCPECGRPFVRALSDEYRKDPHFFRHRYAVRRRHPAGFSLQAGEGQSEPDGT